MMDFRDITGHQQTIAHLQNAIAAGKVSHAYLIAGEKGSGKKTIAGAFAKALLCTELKGRLEAAAADGKTLDPREVDSCGKCPACLKADSGNHPDLVTVTHAKPKSISVDEIREQVVDDAQIRPYDGGYKVYIIPDADLMTAQAQNALLKTLEEPPEYAVLILLASNAGAMLDTILSRTAVLDLRQVSDDQLQHFLVEKLELPEHQARLITAFAQGNVGKAIALASSDDFEEVLAKAKQILEHISDWDVAAICAVIKEITPRKAEIDDLLDLFAIWYCDALYFKATRDPDGIVFREELHEIQERASKSSYEGIQTVLEALDKAKVRLRANVSFDLTMELLLLTMKEN